MMNFLKVITSLFPSLPIYDCIPFPFPSMFSSLFPFHSSPSFLPIYLLVTFFSRPFILVHGPFAFVSQLPSHSSMCSLPFSFMFPSHSRPYSIPIHILVLFPFHPISLTYLSLLPIQFLAGTGLLHPPHVAHLHPSELHIYCTTIHRIDLELS